MILRRRRRLNEERWAQERVDRTLGVERFYAGFGVSIDDSRLEIEFQDRSPE